MKAIKEDQVFSLYSVHTSFSLSGGAATFFKIIFFALALGILNKPSARVLSVFLWQPLLFSRQLRQSLGSLLPFCTPPGNKENFGQSLPFSRAYCVFAFWARALPYLFWADPSRAVVAPQPLLAAYKHTRKGVVVA